MEIIRPIHRIIYVSQATKPLSAADLNSISLVSRSNNYQLGITGVLLYENNHFLQVMEGDRHAVTTLFDRIRQDPRHTDVRTAVEDDIAERQFSRWSMALCLPPEAQTEPEQYEAARRLVGSTDPAAPSPQPDRDHIRRYQCMLGDFLPAEL